MLVTTSDKWHCMCIL